MKRSLSRLGSAGLSAAVLLGLAGTALGGGGSVYVFNTTTGAVTLNGVPVGALGATAIVDRGVAGSVRTWSVQGSVTLPAAIAITFTGTNMAHLAVGGTLWCRWG
jgi:hypothetical protein